MCVLGTAGVCYGQLMCVLGTAGVCWGQLVCVKVS